MTCIHEKKMYDFHIHSRKKQPTKIIKKETLHIKRNTALLTHCLAAL